MITQKRAKVRENELSLTNIMVNNMDPTLSKNDAPKMRAYFTQFGAIITATVHVTDSNFYGPKTVFVEFQNEEDATNCVNFYKKSKVVHYLGGLPIAAKFSYRHSDPKHKKPKTPGNNDGLSQKSKSNKNQAGNMMPLNHFQQQQLAASLQLQNMYLLPQIYQQPYSPFMGNGAYQMPNMSIGNTMMPNFYQIDESQYQQYNLEPAALANYSNMMTNNLLSQMMLNNTSGFIPMNTIPVSNNMLQPLQNATVPLNDENYITDTQ